MKQDLAGHEQSGNGVEGQRLGGRGLAGNGSPGVESTGVARTAKARIGKASAVVERKGEARTGKSRVGMPNQGSQGLAGQGSDRGDGRGRARQETGAPSGAPTYKVRDGARVPKKRAADLAAAMVELTRDGRGTPEALVESAAEKSSPIHDCFDWNDQSAAHAYRVEQARHYWKAIEIVVRVDDSTETKQRAFHPVFIDGERQYQDIGTIAQSQSLMGQLIDQAKRDLIAFKHRYASLSEAAELSAVFAAIDALNGKDAA